MGRLRAQRLEPVSSVWRSVCYMVTARASAHESLTTLAELMPTSPKADERLLLDRP